jgi:hypothetical protein
MLSGRRLAYLVCLFVSTFGCSTDEIQFFDVDASAVSPQEVERDSAAPDLRVNRPDEGLAPDAPAAMTADGGLDVPAADAPSAEVSPSPDLGPDLPLNDLPVGAQCSNKNQCTSGFCVDGVCCNVRCDDGCSACSAARTGKPEGTCGKSADREGTACGASCGTVAGVPSVVEKVCVSGSCVVSLLPRQLESCRDENPCVTSFCDDAAARCVRSKCPQAGNCCCRQASGARMCVKTDTCRNDRVCE